METVLFESNRIGVYHYANGNRYDGRWKNDKKFGRGIISPLILRYNVLYQRRRI